MRVSVSRSVRVRRMNSHYRKHSLLDRAHFALSPTRSPSTRVAPVATHGTAVPIAIQLLLQNTPNTYIALTQGVGGGILSGFTHYPRHLKTRRSPNVSWVIPARLRTESADHPPFSPPTVSHLSNGSACPCPRYPRRERRPIFQPRSISSSLPAAGAAWPRHRSYVR